MKGREGRKSHKLFIVVSSLFAAVLISAAVLLQFAYMNPSHPYGEVINKAVAKIETPKTIDTVIGTDDFPLKAESNDEDLLLSYTSDNPDVATVDEDGTVQIKGKGSAVITVFSMGSLSHTPGFSKTKITVNELAVPKITHSQTGVRSAQIEWKKVDHADGYYVKEYDSAGNLNDTAKVSSDDTFVEFSDRTIGNTYSYEVVAFAETEGEEQLSEPSEKTSETIRDALVGQARDDEHHHLRGGAAGDQTGKEVAIGKWSHGSSWNNWAYVARFKDPEKARIAADAMEAACNNSHIGYDQSNRTSLYSAAKAAKWDIASITTNCECSCSPLVSVCINAAGVSVPAGWWTANKSMKATMEATGEFEFYTDSSYTDSTRNLKRGDILVTPNRHTGMVL